MKKSLFFLAVAAVALASCSSDDTIAENSNVGKNQQKEIAFMPLVQNNTRAAVDGTTFPTGTPMMVAAYDVTNTRDFFAATAFTYSGSGTIWSGSKYWPLSAAYINFLAIANANADNATGVTWGAPTASASPYASKAVVVMSDNSSAQKDLMYAIGNGAVTNPSGNTLNFPTNVPMVFKHAQAWIRFMADAYDAATGGKITLNSITLNGAKYNGTFTVTHTNYDQSSSQSVAGAWSALPGSGTNVAVPNWEGTGAPTKSKVIAYDPSGDGVYVGDGLLIVPDDNSSTADWTSFTINYTLDGNTYEYTYTPADAAAANVDQATKYTFKIVFHLHEIEIQPSVTDWVEGGPTAVPVF